MLPGVERLLHNPGTHAVIQSLVQFERADGGRGVGAFRRDGSFHALRSVESVRALALRAIEAGVALADLAADLIEAVPLDPDALRLRTPIDHADPAHLLVSGTGLTHLGSAEGRDKMHKQAAEAQTDSMKMFLMGIEGGKPRDGAPGVQPEWFYKGDGDSLVATGQPLTMPEFALDGGEEPEIAAIYLIDAEGMPVRLGYALGNEFSDHVTERGNYLWLAHSKLRQAALGPELLLGDLPQDVRGVSRIRRGDSVIWERPFVSGEANMSHALANLEYHHFKYAGFRRPGDVHVHFLGTATLSFSDHVETAPGDVFEIAADAFRLPLANPLRRAPRESWNVRTA